MGANFEWQASKARANVRKHRVSFEEAAAVFADPLARILDDPDHSADESREIIVGHSTRQRLLYSQLRRPRRYNSNHQRPRRHQARTT